MPAMLALDVEEARIDVLGDMVAAVRAQFEAGERARGESERAREASQRALEESERAHAAGERVRRVVGLIVRDIVEKALGLPGLLTEKWKAVIQEVIAERTEFAHAHRESLSIDVDRCLRLLKGAQKGVDLAETVNLAIPGAASLSDAVGEIERFKSKVLDPWQTVEDLEDLVAAEMAPTAEEFDAVRRKYGPPTAWFEHCGEAPTNPQ